MSSQGVAGKLSSTLPEVIDPLTPSGIVPSK
ncbi:MAG: hypothetical protein M3Y55_09875 [Pseudomonadota bacterium]|nr:hypothetical protein [Pseudomonadota bacterium]